MQIDTQMAKLDTDGFGPKNAPTEEEPPKSNGTGRCSGGTAPFNEEGDRRDEKIGKSVHGSSDEDSVGFGVYLGSPLDNRRSIAKGSGNGGRDGDYIHDQSHSLRTLKAMAIVNEALWWCLWGFRIALVATVASLIFGELGQYALIKWPF